MDAISYLQYIASITEDPVLRDAILSTLQIRSTAIEWVERRMADGNTVGCNLGDLQLLLDILEGDV